MSFRVAVVTFSLSGSLFLHAPGAVAGTVVDRLEASANSSIVLLSDVIDFRKTLGLRGQLDPLFAGTPIAAKGLNASDADIVRFLVDERIITEQFAVADAEVEQEISSIQANNQISRDALKAALKEQGYAFEHYFDLIRTSLSKRNLIDRDIRTRVHISEDDIKNHFYNQLPRGTNLTYRLNVIVVNPGNYKSLDLAKKTAEEALRSLRSGEGFESVAKRVSDDPSAQQGGDLGFLSSDEISPIFQKMAKELKVGQVSDVFGSPKTGFFILRLSDLKSGQEDQLEKLRDKISGELTATEYQRQINLWLERERDKAHIHISST